MARASRSARKTTKATPAQRSLGRLPEWNLTDLYAGIDDPAVKRDLERAERYSIAFEEDFKGKLAALANGPDAGRKICEAVKRFEQLDDLLGRLASYAGLVHAQNTVDPARAKFYGDVQERLTGASTHLLFFVLELNRLDDAKLEAAMADPALGYYRPWLEDIRTDKPYQLEDRVEQLFHEKSVTAYSAWNRLFDETIARLRFKVGTKSLAIEPTLNMLQDPREDKRKAAAQAIAATFKDNLRQFTHITNTLAKDKEISDRWRGFADVADSRHLSNRVEPEVVDALVTAVRAAYPRLSHRYYALKARWFGKKRLAHWDRNAPLPRVASRTITWTEAQSTVLTAYGAFSTDMAAIAEKFFKNGWIDAPVRPGKSPGAFAHPTVPSAHPYVLLNYQGKPRDVMTLAHELGHGVHQVLAAPNGPLMAPTPLTLAETASVFGEMLTFRKLLAGITDRKQRKSMLAAKVEDMINTVVRQIAFYTFEHQAPHRTPQGRADVRADQRALDGGAAREPRSRDRSAPRLRDVLGLHPALRAFAVLRLRLCIRRLPRELALFGLRAIEPGLCRALSPDARGRRHQALFRAARSVRPRCPRPGVLAGRIGRDRPDDHGAGSDRFTKGVRLARR